MSDDDITIEKVVPGTSSIDFLRCERDPKKRKVKVVQQSLPVYESDGSTDSDFNVEAHKKRRRGSNGNGVACDTGASDDSRSDDAASSSDGEEEESGDGSSSEEGGRVRENGEESSDDVQMVNGHDDSRHVSSKESEPEVLEDVNAKSIIICSACLGQNSNACNELVECDWCGISVHEACYGVGDNVSVSSTVSSCSTEPWFCEPCKAGVANPVCELCPNLGGIFKGTDSGKWVHLMCALYVKGVTFADGDRLTCATLTGISYTMWGAKSCVYCENPKLSRTGICVRCDAGLCRTYFHVTCAQRGGLLSEARLEESHPYYVHCKLSRNCICVRCDAGLCRTYFHVTCAQRGGLLSEARLEESDPYYAHCKLHTDKELFRKRRRNWLALQQQLRKKKTTIAAVRNQKVLPAASANDMKRIERKLSKARWTGRQEREKTYKQQRSGHGDSSPLKKPRLLTTSASAMRLMARKSELMGLDKDALESMEEREVAMLDAQKRYQVSPAFSIQFISYYLDRNRKVGSLKSRVDAVRAQHTKLQSQQKKLRPAYDQLHGEYKDLYAKASQLRESGKQLYESLQGMYPPGSKKIPPLPAMFLPQEMLPDDSFSIANISSANIHVQNGDVSGSSAVAKASSSHTGAGKRSMSPSYAPRKQPKDLTDRHRVRHHSSSSSHVKTKAERKAMSPMYGPVVMSPDQLMMALHECKVCKKTHDQHLLCMCDTCKKWYHLGCLDPPLSRMPKKTKLYGWQCVACDRGSSCEELLANVDTSAPRKLRQSNLSFSRHSHEPLNRDESHHGHKHHSHSNHHHDNHEHKHRHGSGGSGSGGAHEQNGIPPKSAIAVRHSVGGDGGQKPSAGEKRPRLKPGPKPGSKPKPKADASAARGAAADVTIATANGDVSHDGAAASTASSLLKVNVHSGASDKQSPAPSPMPHDLESNATESRSSFGDAATDGVGCARRSSATGRRSKTPSASQASAVLTKCDKCEGPGDNNNLVRCDECKRCYHFHCLDPPVKKSPKVRGWTWHCESCDPTDHSSSD